MRRSVPRSRSPRRRRPCTIRSCAPERPRCHCTPPGRHRLSCVVDHREAVNNLNVYPVPDGDTGTNMSLTLRSVVDELDGADPDMASVRGDRPRLAHGRPWQQRGDHVADSSWLLHHRRRFDIGRRRSVRRRWLPPPRVRTAQSATRWKARSSPSCASRASCRRCRRVGADLLGVLDAARSEGASRCSAHRPCPRCSPMPVLSTPAVRVSCSFSTRR